MKYTYSPVHADVMCEDCDWKAKSYKNAQACAASHAKKYKHKTFGEIAIAIGYNGHEEAGKK